MTNNLQVKTFDEEKLNNLIKNSDIYIQQYIKALKKVSNGWERLFQDTMKKIREQNKNKECMKSHCCSHCDNFIWCNR